MTEDDTDPQNTENLTVKIVGTFILIFALIPYLVYMVYVAFKDFLCSFPDEVINVDPKITMIETEIDTWT